MSNQSVPQIVVHTQGKQWNRVLAGLLSFLFPGLGQVYRGRLLTGFLWFVCTVIGYVAFVAPGVVLHLCCILAAMSGDTSK